MDITIWTSMTLVAQAEGGGGGGMLQMLWPLIAIGFLFWFLLLRPQQRERQQREAMLAAVKKKDQVVTIGGIYGEVTDVHHKADKVTIKVAEITIRPGEVVEVKIPITVGSIARILGDDSSGDSSSKK